MARKYTHRLNVDVLRTRIKYHQRSGRTLVVAAELAGLAYDTVASWITKGSLTTRKSAEEFSRVLDVPVDVLFKDLFK